ncbi:MAG TPA: phosphate acyltransferase PlsX [Candidatus Omnitrophota bacterium]|nr:phosphate acyltransferase PlsX [Candidatus Omnitrophota bacterium]
MKIVVDAMGGDFAPGTVVEGAIAAVKELDVDIVLVGLEERVKAELKKHGYPKERIEIVHAPEVVGMDEPATVSIRTKKNSSISIGVNLLKKDSYDAFVSAGNTGAVVCASTVYLGMIEGVERPAIGLVLPTLKGFSFLIDVGANTVPKPPHLLHSAQMAHIYAQQVLNVSNPRIGLLNIGEEEAKGSDFVKETYKLFTERLKNFIGNIEANEVFTGKCDCIICDGFVGNVIIKVSEGLMESAGVLIKREIKKDPLALIGAILMKSRLNHIKKFADYSEYGGAPLLGVNGIVMISHGRSNAKAIKNAIRAAKREGEHEILSKIKQEVLG